MLIELCCIFHVVVRDGHATRSVSAKPYKKCSKGSKQSKVDLALISYEYQHQFILIKQPHYYIAKLLSHFLIPGTRVLKARRHALLRQRRVLTEPLLDFFPSTVLVAVLSSVLSSGTPKHQEELEDERPVGMRP